VGTDGATRDSPPAPARRPGPQMSGPSDFRPEHSEYRAAGEFASEDLPYHADWRGSLEKLPWALDEEARSGWSTSTRIFFADHNSKYRDLKLLMPREGAMFWTDNMCIPLHAQNPKDAMTLMDFYYQPQVQATLDYYLDYVCPVPHARQVLLHPSGWAAATLKELQPVIGLPPSVTANAPTVFPSQRYTQLSRNYYQFKNQEELSAWNNLFLPITQGT
jgi:spermidine/putrescine-binding protein